MRNERFDFIHLPEKYQSRHKACEFLLYQIEDFVTKIEYQGLKKQTVRGDEDNVLNDTENILDYLLRTDNQELHDNIISSNIIYAIIIDITYFFQIALYASLQKRLTVTFALLRKPFVYDLLLLLRLYFTSDFLEKFNTQDNFDTTALSQEDIIALLKISEETLLSKSITASDIYDFIFNQQFPNSIINISNKALHPTTTRKKNNLTGRQNLNFVFSNDTNIQSQWDYLYATLPLLMLYLVEVLEFIVFDHLKLKDEVYNIRLIERAIFFDENGNL